MTQSAIDGLRMPNPGILAMHPPLLRMPEFQAQIQHIPIEKLIAYPNNVKQHPPEQIDTLVNSIAEFGFLVPIVIDQNDLVIAGHGRLIAAKKMKLKQVPCIIGEHLSPEQVRAFRIMENKSAESPWDEQALFSELAELAELDFDLTLTGWDSADLTAFDEPETQYQERQTVGTAPRMPAMRQQSDDEPDDGDDLADDDEQPAAPPPPVGDKYPVAIVLNSGELKEWKERKEQMGERLDKTAFLKLMRGEA